jgi:hypothetical protein
MIYMGHTMEFLALLLGQPRTVSARLQTTCPYVSILNSDKVLKTGIKKTANNYTSLHRVMDIDVPYTYTLRGGDAFQEGEGLI